MDQTQTEKDKRKFPRIPKEVSIEVCKIEYPLPDGTGKTGVVKNIAQDGICITASSPYEPKTVLSLKIELRGWQQHKKNISSIVDASTATAPLTAVAEVIWSNKLSDDPGYEVGVKFLDIYEDDYYALKTHLDNLMKDLA